MNGDSSRFEVRAWLRKAALVGPVLLLALWTDNGRPPAAGSERLREVRVHGHRLDPGWRPPAFGEEEDRDGGSERERLDRWIESRHRAAPGVDWHAIEAANLRAALARMAAPARGPQPVWHERGPVNMAGATAFTAVRPDGRTLLVASLRGGIFSGTPGGKAWTRLTDSLGSYLRGFVVSSPPETWVAAAFSLRNAQVYASRNHGTSWSEPHGLPPLYDVYELLQDGGDHRTIYLLAAAFAPSGDVVPILARSRDGGLSFTVVYQGTSYEQPGLWTSRISAGPLYLMSHGQLSISTDQGDSFSPLGAIDPTVTRTVLRGSEAGAPTLYAAAGQGSPSDLYVSEDGGRTWEKRFHSSGISLLGNSLVASPWDPDLVLFGFTNGWRSTDGGRSFTQINDWSDYYADPAGNLHADVRGLQFFLYRGQETLFLPTDGGTYMSTDGGASVHNITLNGLPNAQIYSTWSSSASPDLFVAGSQDQGFQQSIRPRGGRPGSPLSTAQRISGDYGNLTSASHDLADVFAFYPGYLFFYSPGGDFESSVFAPLPAMSAGSFFATSAADPDDPSTVYVAGDHIWKMRYLGGEDFAQTQLPQSFSPDNKDYVSALAIAPADHNLWYAATFEGHLWYSRDHGATWTESESTRQSSFFYSANTALLVSASDPLTCFAAGSGYSGPSVLVTRDGGVHWSPLADGLPPTIVWSLAFDGPATQTLYAATDAGPFVLDAGATTWRSLLGGSSPVLPYYSVEGVPSAHLVRFGTFGRGVWDYVPPGRP
ncbi:MAG TPA: hypothetical protein VGM86_05765 [Thermoanaerobaculia bacterium]|jgi:photosystem II stability/assembly factor-like uncharacterized protein